MLYNDNNLKFIFIHIPKCAGTSIENFFGIDYDKYNPNTDYKKYIELNTKIAHPKHFRLSNYEELLGIDEVSDYFKFTFIRNPYDMVVSKYEFLRNNNNSILKDVNGNIVDNSKICFESYVNFLLKYSKRKKNKNSVTVDNYNEWIVTENNKMDFIGKVENFDNDFKIVCDKLNIKYKKLNKINKTNNRKGYKTYYNEYTKGIVTNLFKYDLEKYNYNF